jgi:hypothetical protein
MNLQEFFRPFVLAHMKLRVELHETQHQLNQVHQIVNNLMVHIGELDEQSEVHAILADQAAIIGRRLERAEHRLASFSASDQEDEISSLLRQVLETDENSNTNNDSI